MFYPTNTWQELNWNPAYGSSDFFAFCSNVTNMNAPENITSVDHVLAQYTDGESWTNLGNYANYVKQVIVPICESGDINSSACFGTQNGSSHSLKPYPIDDIPLAIRANEHTASFWAAVANDENRSYLYSSEDFPSPAAPTFHSP